MKIFVLDDDKNTRRSLQVALENAGHHVTTEYDPVISLDFILNGSFDILVFDIRLGEVSGVDLFRKLRQQGVDIPTIFMSGHASLTEAVESIHLGAFDFLEKPFPPEKLLFSISRCMEIQSLKRRLREFEGRVIQSNELVGNSHSLLKVKRSISRVATTNSPVLITGESGTGKELIARAIHLQSRVQDGPFIKINCSAIPENLFESEFFGFEKGAFTGANAQKKGYFEQAHKGSILLDEIGDMPLLSQAKLLRVLQSHEIQRLGAERSVPVQVRVIASTHRDLASDVKAGRFREDLYYRLNVFPIESPALRERREDIALLATHFLNEYCASNGMAQKFLSERAIRLLMNYDWPGNIRELKNVIERMAILGSQTLDESLVPDFVSDRRALGVEASALSLKEFRRRCEREYIVKVLTETSGNVSEAARQLAIERTYLHKVIQQFGISKREFFD